MAKDWLHWSLCIDGPLFFKVPSPMGSPIDQTDPEYQVSRHFILCHHHYFFLNSFLKAASFLILSLILLPLSLVSGWAQPQRMDIQKD